MIFTYFSFMKFETFPLINKTIALIVGILLGTFFSIPMEMLLFLFVVTMVLLGIVGFFYHKKSVNPVFFQLLSLFVFLQLGTFVLFAHQDKNQNKHYSHFLVENDAEILIEISDVLKKNQYNQQYFAKIKSLNKQEVLGTILVKTNVSDSLPPFEIGQIILCKTTIADLPRQKNPNQFEYANYLSNKEIFHEVALQKAQFLVVGKEEGWFQKVAATRQMLSQKFDETTLDPSNKGVIKALLIGIKQDVDAQTAAQYTEAGAIHLLAISGLHVSIIMYLFVFVLKPLKRFKHGTLLQTVLIILFLWGFAFLAGMSASVVRSVTMFSFVAIGLQLSHRGKNIYNTLAISAFLLLIFHPFFLFDVGFQLSYLAVISIVTFQPYFSRILKRPKNTIVGYFHDVFTVSLAAQLGVLPLSIFYFHQFPGLFFLTNMVVIPLATPILGFGILALIFGFFTSIPMWLTFILDILLHIMNVYIAFVAHFEDFIFRNIPINLTLLLLSYLVLLFFGFCAKKGFKNYFIPFLVSVILLQIGFVYTDYKHLKEEKYWVLHQYRNSVLMTQNEQKTTIYSANPSLVNNKVIENIAQAHFSEIDSIKLLRNVYSIGKKKMLIIDSLGVVPDGLNPDILWITQSPKINFDRILASQNPEKVIVDGSNKPYLIKMWKASCASKKIPVHVTFEQGFYEFE